MAKGTTAIRTTAPCRATMWILGLTAAFLGAPTVAFADEASDCVLEVCQQECADALLPFKEECLYCDIPLGNCETERCITQFEGCLPGEICELLYQEMVNGLCIQSNSHASCIQDKIDQGVPQQCCGYYPGSPGCAVDECDLDTDNCDSNATCTDTPESFTCECNSGWSGNGVTCADVNECDENLDNCHNNATCTNTDGGFLCECNSGYSGSGTHCSNVDECEMDLDNCDVNATCTDNKGSFTCACNAGFVGDGVTCADIDECSVPLHDCDMNATCTNTVGAYVCECHDGFVGDGVTCILDVDGDGWVQGDDCDDTDVSVFPGASELCDKKDNDCDSSVDEGTPDGDSDGVCDELDVCPGHSDSVDTDNDGTADGCDPCPNDANDDSDEDGSCDGDDLCQGDDDSGDEDGDGYCALDVDGATAVDCDDAMAEVNPGAEEICDELDNDCDGTVDGTDSDLDCKEIGPDAGGGDAGSPGGDAGATGTSDVGGSTICATHAPGLGSGSQLLWILAMVGLLRSRRRQR
ncbi:MAG: hypothetical protein KC416_11105 [Myxococcales bacterium]|nr:hypothetical protein [Myxococcales bacterium]